MEVSEFQPLQESPHPCRGTRRRFAGSVAQAPRSAYPDLLQAESLGVDSFLVEFGVQG